MGSRYTAFRELCKPQESREFNESAGSIWRSNWFGQFAHSPWGRLCAARDAVPIVAGHLIYGVSFTDSHSALRSIRFINPLRTFPGPIS